jgi:dTDP-4-amino-4,6-dideoxygalactose transaminase
VSDPRRAALAHRDQLAAVFARVLDSGRYIHGPEHDAFEAEFSSFLGVRHCIALASGTDALELALIAVGCRPGDSVLTAANAGGYASAAARKAGFQVRLADVDPATLCLSRATVEAALSAEVRAVVVTHLYGVLADAEGIVALCREGGIAVVEDCAQAAGARRGAWRAGGFGDAATFSFYPTKNLAALGDGGAVTTKRDDVADAVRLLRQYGWKRKYEVTIPAGRNSRLDEVQGAVLRERLPRLDDWNERRRAIVRRYARALAPRVGRFVSREGDDYVAHLAVVLTEERDRLRDHFAKAGIGTDIHYPVADHQQPAWCDEFADLSLPVTEHAVRCVLTLPCFPELTDEEIERVCEALDGI